MIILAYRGLKLGWEYRGTNLLEVSRLEYFLINLGPELAGIVIGVVVIDALNNWRQTQQLKAQLIRQMGSPIRDVAVPASRELDHHGWLYDGSLKGADLSEANLSGADLINANLEGADLTKANLESTVLIAANLNRADFWYANMKGTIFLDANIAGADFQDADLDKAVLWDANLEKAFLKDANLRGTFQYGANLNGAEKLSGKQLRMAKTVARATMPDGVKLHDSEGVISMIYNLVGKKMSPESAKILESKITGGMRKQAHPYLDGPSLEEWLATKPDCLVWEDEEE